MVYRVAIPFMEITYKDVFSMKFLYTVMHEWLMLNEYVDIMDEPMHQFIEALYFERRIGVRELRMWWRGYKYPVGPKDSSYYRYKMRIDMRVINMVDTEVVRNGKKMKVQDGEITLEIYPYLELDFNNQWQNHPILKYFDNIFRKRIIYNRIMEHKRLLYKDAYRLHGFIKKYLEIKSFSQEIEVFHEKFDRL